MTSSTFSLGGFAGNYNSANTGILSKSPTNDLSVGTPNTSLLATGTANANTFLCGDGTWKTVVPNTSLLATGTANANTFLCGDGTWKVVISGTSNPPIITNSNTILTSYTFAPGINGLSVGPMSMANGVSVTIPPAQRWIIL